MTRTFPSNPYRRYLEQATPERRHGSSIWLAVGIIVAAVAISTVVGIAIVGWLS